MGDEPHQHNSPSSGDVYERVVTEGRRRLRRRRLSAGAMAGLLVAAGAVTIGLTAAGHQGGTRVAIGDNSAAVCRPGGPVLPGVARTDSSVRFGLLPVGYHLQSGTPGTVADGLTGRRQLRLNLQTIDPGSPFNPSSTAPNTTVQGHPATMVTAASGSVLVSWRPDPATELSVTGSNATTEDVLAAAQQVSYQPGQRAGAVGDVGTVIPRSTALADAGFETGVTTQTITWLTTNSELTATLPLNGEDPNGEVDRGAPPDRPLWVVAHLGTYLNNTEGSFNNGPNGGSAHLEVSVVDGVTGFEFMTVTGGNATIYAEFASLTDHSLNPPCPSPSPTNPNSLPPRHEPTTYSSTAPPITTTAIAPSASSTEITIAAGTNQGITVGDSVTTSPSPSAPHGQLVGTVDQPGPTTSTVQLITATGSTTPVALDAQGNDAVLLGHGPDQPLQAELVNRSLALRIGMPLLSTGPPNSPVVGGIPAGRITEATTQGGVPDVLVAPDFTTANLDHLTVARTATSS